MTAHLVARHANRQTVDQVCDLLVNYMGDGGHELPLTIDSPSTATAQEIQATRMEENILCNVKVTLQPAGFKLPQTKQ